MATTFRYVRCVDVMAVVLSRNNMVISITDTVNRQLMIDGSVAMVLLSTL